MADTLFEKFYNAKDEVLAAIAKPVVRRKLKSRFQAVQISIGEEIAKLEVEQNEIFKNVEDLNINRLTEIGEDIDVKNRDLERIKKLYADWFGGELKDIDED